MKQSDSLLEKFGRLVNMVGTAVMVNVMFLIACIPVVTVGPALNALFSAIRYQIRGEKWFLGFRTGFTTRFWRSTVSWLILLVAFVVMALDVNFYLHIKPMTAEIMIRLAVSCLMLVLVGSFTCALQILNVYIPTDITTWLKNGVNMLFNTPLQMLGAGALLCGPVLLALVRLDWFFYLIMVFIAAYYILSGLGITMLLKNALLIALKEARDEGTLRDERSEDTQEETDNG